MREEKENQSAWRRRLEVAQLYKPHGTSSDLCKAVGLDKDSLTSATKLRELVTKYILDHALVNAHDHGYINLDDLLTAALLKKGEQLDFLPRSQVLDRLLKNMQPWYSTTLTYAGKTEEATHRGVLPKIAVAVKKRQGRKLVTIIEGATQTRGNQLKWLKLIARHRAVSNSSYKARRRFAGQVR